MARVADSVRRTATFVRERREDPDDGPDLFLTAEQSLVLGHPLHPAPKSREGLSEAEATLYSPESRGSFRLHWLAVEPSVLATDSAWTERGRLVGAAQLSQRLAGPDLALPDGRTALPLHPWQLREVRHRPETAPLFDTGLLQDLGAHGSPWYPTSSVRTVHRSGAPAMLKLSLGLRITNSRRENLRKELHRGVEVHRLLRSGLSKEWQATHPAFDIVRDPAWLAIDGPDGSPVPGIDVVIRHNPFSPSHDVSCIAGLVSPRPRARAGVTGDRPEMEGPVWRSRLAEVVTRLAACTGRPRGAVAAEWFLRYLEHVVRPVLWLDGEAGIALEAHQQNTLVLLDGDGWPAGGRYRDNQGYYFRESRRAELDARLPGIGAHSDTFVSDDVTDERFVYYLAINNVLGLVGALGSQRLADERVLLAAFRRFLTGVASGPTRLRTTLPGRLLDSPVLRCKANLLTRVHGLDELVGPVDTQSVYVSIANPFTPEEHDPPRLLRGAPPCLPLTRVPTPFPPPCPMSAAAPVPPRARTAPPGVPTETPTEAPSAAATTKTHWTSVCRTNSSHSSKRDSPAQTTPMPERRTGNSAGAPAPPHLTYSPVPTHSPWAATTCSTASPSGDRSRPLRVCSTSCPCASSGIFLSSGVG